MKWKQVSDWRNWPAMLCVGRPYTVVYRGAETLPGFLWGHTGADIDYYIRRGLAQIVAREGQE